VSESGVLKNSGLMALGTIASRLTGILRDVVMVSALGFALLSDAFSQIGRAHV